MFGRNVDFFAVLAIALAMLGFAELRTLHWPDALDSIRIGNAIDVERCPLSTQVLSSLSAMLH